MYNNYIKILNERVAYHRDCYLDAESTKAELLHLDALKDTKDELTREYLEELIENKRDL